MTDPVTERSERTLAISLEEANNVISHICGTKGFVDFHSPDRGGRILTAYPVQNWRIPLGKPAFLQVMADIKAQHRAYSLEGSISSGGLFGSLFYEAGRCTVPGFSDSAAHPTEHGGYVGLYLWELFIADANNPAEGAHLAFHPACDDHTQSTVLGFLGQPFPEAHPGFRITRPFQGDKDKTHYLNGVGKVLDYIHAGDCYQANLSNKYLGQWSGSPYQAYTALTNAIPVPYCAYLDAGAWQVLSISPELFLSIRGRQVVTKPIKGTRPRNHASVQKDKDIAEELSASIKDRAENLMIVDLLRNDLSRFCQSFSVRVSHLFDIESYENVHQLVSTVEGTLDEHHSPLDAMLMAFPGGSITGAPKRRAMEIISELECHARGPYCGTLFQWDFNNNLESNIAIRTLMTESNGSIHCWAGCGIVADSDPEEEYQESVTKVGKLMRVLESL